MLVLSPHLDDAVLSLGATIAAFPGPRRVVTVMSRTSASKISSDFRCHEDHAALAILGAEPLHLDVDDAPLRGFALEWEDLCELNLARAFHIDTSASLDMSKLSTILAPLLHGPKKAAPTPLLIPMAVGGHVDHQAVLLAVLTSINGSDGTFHLYEDQPYALRAASIADAWERLGAEVLAWEDAVVDESLGKAFYDVVAPHLLPSPANTRIPSEVRWRGQRWRRHPAADLLPANPSVSAARHLDAKRRAVTCYQSQHGLLFGAPTTATTTATPTLSDVSLWPERIWSTAPPSIAP